MKDKTFKIEELEKNRKKIDKIDNKILNLLSKRGRIVLKIGIIKKQAHIDITQPQREEEIIDRLKIKSKVLDKVSIENIWREIIEGCKLIQNIRVIN